MNIQSDELKLCLLFQAANVKYLSRVNQKHAVSGE